MSETHTETIKRLLKFRQDTIASLGVEPTHVFVTPDEYSEILSSPMFSDGGPIKPSPPIKTRETKTGFFSSYSKIEYDHTAPDYLKSLDEYNKAMDKFLTTLSSPQIFGMKLEVRNNCE